MGQTEYPVISSDHFNAHALMKFLSLFNHTKYSLLSLLIMYSCKKFVVLGLIPLISKYLWNDFCNASSKSL